MDHDGATHQCRLGVRRALRGRQRHQFWARVAAVSLEDRRTPHRPTLHGLPLSVCAPRQLHGRVRVIRGARAAHGLLVDAVGARLHGRGTGDLLDLGDRILPGTALRRVARLHAGVPVAQSISSPESGSPSPSSSAANHPRNVPRRNTPWPPGSAKNRWRSISAWPSTSLNPSFSHNSSK